MSYVTELMDNVKAACKLPSDYALAKKLDVTPAAVSKWRLHRSFPDWDSVFKMADLLQLDDQNVVCKMLEEKNENPRVINALRQAEAS
ncbi:helix-turn-helix domain-containing protein [Enterovibrio calviensis]|uniref:helix-turn-helix domain-containing protein n=1 Tax=Enterovibrio calviensis TaxID=91359 RepID=UPI000480B0A4|nr:helix-turn-helix transcriptional regulator [Enterovibrio calviensis]